MVVGHIPKVGDSFSDCVVQALDLSVTGHGTGNVCNPNEVKGPCGQSTSGPLAVVSHAWAL